MATAGDQEEVSVGTEHLLLVLALDPGQWARRVLTDLRVDIALIKKELACYVAGSPRQARRFRRRKPQAACPFCGAGQTPTRPLVRGPGVTICGTCAQRAVESLASVRRAAAGRAITP